MIFCDDLGNGYLRFRGKGVSQSYEFGVRMYQRVGDKTGEFERNACDILQMRWKLKQATTIAQRRKCRT